MFKSKKFEKGDFTAFMSVKGEVKKKKGEIVKEKISAGVDDVTGEEIFREVPALHKFTMLNIIRNYEEGTEPEEKESYLFFMSNNPKEGDWVSKDKETKEILGELFYNESTKELSGFLGKTKVRIPVADENERMFQVYEEILQNSVLDTDMF